MEECMGCVVKAAEVEIVLADGHVLYSCVVCTPLVIRENASTDNPVHSMSLIEGDGDEDHEVVS